MQHAQSAAAHQTQHSADETAKNYVRFATVISINAAVMFFLTYVMIDTVEHFHFNLNRLYMALVMVAPMAILMLVVMRSMYAKKSLNALLYIGFGALFVVALAFARTQTPIGNEQFLRSMIPHHSSAILMCERATITDPEITELCRTIVRAQKDEIARMARMLERY